MAVKVIRVEKFTPEALARALKRFERKAKALARLTHPNIVKVTNYGEYEDRPYLVMPFLPGGNLKQLLKERGRLNWRTAARTLIPIGRALEYTHSQGIIHRDVKPSNILITQSGETMLSDFGIARMLETGEVMGLTRPGVGMGTPEYMAPEQALGKSVDHRADIYALGVVFYEMVTGRTPYQADTPLAVLIKKSSEPLPRPGQFLQNIPEAVEKVLFKALAKDPAERYQDAGAFAEALERLGRGEVEGVWGKTVKEAPKTMRMAWLVGGATLLIVLGAVLGIWLQNLEKKGLTPLAGLAIHPTKLMDSSTLIASTTPIFHIGSTWIRPADGMVMVVVPAGNFLKGSNASDPMAQIEEEPQQKIFLDIFWIDRTDVTNAMYALCVKAEKCPPPTQSSSYTHSNYYGNPQYADYPVINISWAGAEMYCSWAGARLPTEAEWEKAARGTDGRIYPWGNSKPDKSMLNYNDNVGDTSAVGSYPAGVSPYGAPDMAGNVWNWVNDWYDLSLPSSNSQAPYSGIFQVMRGGSCFSDEILVRSANRSRENPLDSSDSVGFRCSR